MARVTTMLLLLLAVLPPAHGLEWRDGRGFRSAALPVPQSGHAGFRLMEPAPMGIGFTNHLPHARVAQFQNTMNGTGLACGDVDGDGWVDLYFCNKSGPNVLYRNLGNGTFSNITASAGVACANLMSVGAVFGDINGDGQLDLLVSSFGGPHACFLGDGKGKFTDFTVAAGITNSNGSTSLALSDVDGDGDLDLYWCNFGTLAPLRDGVVLSERMVNGKPTVTGRWAKKVRIIDGQYFEYGDPDTLYINDGKGHFRAADWGQAFSGEDGKPMEPPWDFGLAVQIRDINGDGNPDIYVCNDFQTPDRMWLGDGRGHFRELSGLAMRNMSYASMGVDFADIDRDGWVDFYTVEMLSFEPEHHLRTSSSMRSMIRGPGLGKEREDFARNCLYRNRGDGTWEEIALYAGVAATDWSWTPVFLDVDLDGWEDLLVSNGHVHDVNDRDVAARVKPVAGRDTRANKDMLAEYPALEPPKFAFRNRRDLTFENVSEAWGFNSRRIAHGMIAADLDNDGDLDLVLNCIEGGPLIYRNESSAPRVMVRLKGRAPNTAAIGAKVTLMGGPVVQSQEIIGGGQYLSCSEPARVFAAGTGPMTLEIRWRNGKRSVIDGIEANRVYEVDESTCPTSGDEPAAGSVKAGARGAATLFQDLTERLGHRHYEELFDDFSTQALLPRRFSQLGPGVVVTDVDGDGHDDVVVGAGRGGRLEVRLGDGRGGFTNAVVDGPVLADDTAGVVALPMKGGASIVAGMARFESAPAAMPGALRFQGVGGRLKVGESIAGNASSAGPLALGDLDGDGDLDLFIGGRLVPGHYPEGAASQVLRNDGGRLVPDVENTKAVAAAGMVSGATWADLDGDGWPELVLACEWGPVRVLKNEKGRLTERTRELGLEGWTGWWNSVATGDFDGDGRLDLVAGNWGLNSLWQAWGAGTPGVAYGDFEGNGSTQIIETRTGADGRTGAWRDRDLIGLGWPTIVSRFPVHREFASANLAALLGEAAPRAKILKAAVLASAVFLNRGDHFEMKALPREAQFSPAFGLSVADFDGDGSEDVFIGQNYFAVRPEDMRLDAGRGLLLRGDGKGGFAVMSGVSNGIAILGEQRGTAVGDFDEDGRPDLVVTQNGEATRLFRNVGGAPGIRIRLVGPPGNPSGLGAMVRLHFGERRGPTRVVSGGGGYYSQDSAVLVLAAPETPSGVEVLWPGGTKTTAVLPANTWRITVAGDGVMSEK